MNKKDIITLVVAISIFVIAIFFVFQMLLPSGAKKQEQPTVATSSENFEFTKKEIDEKTLQTVEKLTDYYKPKLENIGKEDLFK
jgi:flagellar basal body-associated protein FliL